GIKSEIPEQPSICLGSADVSLIELVGTYTTFINKGVHVAPIFVTRIADKSGNVIQDFVAEQKEVLDEKTAYTMIELLRGVVRFGTGQRLRFKYNLLGDIIGKTGTTQNNSDGWFVGATPDLLAGSWVGCEDRYIRFRSMAYGQGASTALPIWAKFMQKAYSDSTHFPYSVNNTFAKSANINVSLDCNEEKDFYAPVGDEY